MLYKICMMIDKKKKRGKMMCKSEIFKFAKKFSYYSKYFRIMRKCSHNLPEFSHNSEFSHNLNNFLIILNNLTFDTFSETFSSNCCIA